jgi:hypothetical protein
MDAPSPRYIITRATFLIATAFVILYAISLTKKIQRKSAIFAELRSITSDSSYFHQFYAEDAQKSLVRAVALIAEANELGTPPDQSIDCALGIDPAYFKPAEKPEEVQPRERIIRSSLANNYENFRKLGYRPDFQTLSTMKEGMLPPIPSGPEAGKKPLIVTLIAQAASPGIEKVLANLEIRPPSRENVLPTDLQIAAAKQLINDMVEARLIEESISSRLADSLSTPQK